MTQVSGDFRRFRAQVLRRTAIAGGAAGGVLFSVAGPSQALGFWLGALVSAVNLHLHGVDVESQSRMGPSAAARRAGLGSLGRSFLRVAALSTAYLRPEMSFAWAAAGLFTGHAVLMASQLSRPGS